MRVRSLIPTLILSLMMTQALKIDGAQAGDTKPPQVSASIPSTSLMSPSLSATSAQTIPTEAPKRFSVVADILNSSTLVPEAAESAGVGYSQSGLYRLDLGVSLSDTLKGLLRAGYSQEYSYVLDDGSTGGPVDTSLSLMKSMGEVAKQLSISLGLGGLIPTSRDSIKRGMKSAVSAKTDLKFVSGNTEIHVVPKYTEYFHDLEVAGDGKPNMQRTFKVELEYSYSLTSQLSLDFNFNPRKSWTYFGTTRNAYVTDYSVGYEFNKHVNLALGVSTDASALKGNGIEDNYSTFDAAQATGYLDMRITL